MTTTRKRYKPLEPGGVEIQFIYEKRPASAYINGHEVYFLVDMFHGESTLEAIKRGNCVEVNGRIFISEREAVTISSLLRCYLLENRYFLIRIASAFKAEMAFAA